MKEKNKIFLETFLYILFLFFLVVISLGIYGIVKEKMPGKEWLISFIIVIIWSFWAHLLRSRISYIKEKHIMTFAIFSLIFYFIIIPSLIYEMIEKKIKNKLSLFRKKRKKKQKK